MLSALVAVLSGAEAILRSGQKWKLYRSGADSLANEGMAFFQGLRAYEGLSPADSLKIFKAKIEDGISEFHELYLADVDLVITQDADGSVEHKPILNIRQQR